MATSYIPMVNNYVYLGGVTASGTVSYTLSSGLRAVMFIIGQGSRTQGMIIICVNGVGTVAYSVHAMQDNTYLTVSSTGNNNLTISNSTSSVNPSVYALTFTGTISRDVVT